MSEAQKAQSPGGAGLSADQTHRTEIVAGEEIQGNTAKRLANLKAHFALRGFEVHDASDGFVVCRWNLARHCPDLHALAAFARHVGAV